MVAQLADQREIFNSVQLQTLRLLLIARLNQLSLRHHRQFQFRIREPLIQHIHQPRFPSLNHLQVVGDLLLDLVGKAAMLLLEVSVAMAM